MFSEMSIPNKIYVSMKNYPVGAIGGMVLVGAVVRKVPMPLIAKIGLVIVGGVLCSGVEAKGFEPAPVKQ